MKRIILIMSAIAIFWSCEEIPNEIIEPKTVDYIVKSITAPEIFVYAENNKILSTSIVINSDETVEDVWFNILTSNGLENISTFNRMSNNQYSGNKIYLGEIALDPNLLSGKYEIIYYIKDNVRSSDNNVTKVAAKQFEFLSDAQNLPPIVSKLNIPSEVNRNTEFVFSVGVEDPNGKSDIQLVYFTLKRPDGSIVYSNPETNLEKFPMVDDATLGDAEAGDGIYSLSNSFGSSSQVGFWTFTFAAIDYSDSVSNIITHKLKVN